MDKLQEESRRQFEEWWDEECCHLEGSDEASFVRYVSWEAWKASRAAIVVEPTHFILKNEISGPWGCDEDLQCYTLKLDACKAKEDFGGEIIPAIYLRSIGLLIKGE